MSPPFHRPTVHLGTLASALMSPEHLLHSGMVGVPWPDLLVGGVGDVTTLQQGCNAEGLYIQRR